MNTRNGILRERELFDRCVDKPAAEWENILLAHCPDDADLRSRVRRLLERHLDTLSLEGSFLRRDPGDPERIGPYRILQRLGEGGMGIVYAAEQREPVRRRVAIKVLRAGYNSREVLARFDAERQALALMDHPNIARILDAGTTADHRPYIVMEYVPGEAITRYYERHQLALRNRLTLFCGVCEAVQHAHQKGVIHRDLKPSNILIMEMDGRPVPKVIDFGIAKAVSQQLTEHTLETKVGSVLGTPDYMSPEQAELSPLDVDTRSDIYALGAVLYQLLSGAPPLELASADKSYAEIQRAIREQEPAPPSQRAKPEWRKAIRGELDWITGKALEKQRARRYETAAAFADDIRRFLAGEVPEAGPHTLRYSLAKFARRHALGVGILGSAFALITAFAVLMAWQVRQTALERDRANQETATAQAVSQFLVDVFRGADPVSHGGKTLSAREVLDNGVAQMDERFPEPSATRAALYRSVGTAYLNLGRYAEAERLLTQSLDDSAIVYGPVHENTLRDMHSVGRLLYSQGRFLEALEHFQRMAATAREALGSEHEMTLQAQANVAAALEALGRGEEAINVYAELLPVMRRVLGAEHLRTIYALANYGSALETSGLFEEALPVLTQAKDQIEELHGRDHPNAIGARFNVANVLHALDRLEEAENLHRAVFEDNLRVLGPSHPYTFGSMRALAEVLEDRGDHREALALMRSAWEGQRDATDPNEFGRLEAMIGYARLLRAGGDPDAAEPLLLEGIAKLGNIIDEEHWLLARAWREIALIEFQRGHQRESLDAAQKALQAGASFDDLRHTELGRLPGFEALGTPPPGKK